MIQGFYNRTDVLELALVEQLHFVDGGLRHGHTGQQVNGVTYQATGRGGATGVVAGASSSNGKTATIVVCFVILCKKFV